MAKKLYRIGNSFNSRALLSNTQSPIVRAFIDKIPETTNVIENCALRVQTGVLNEIVAQATAMQQPPSDKGKRLRLYYITQVSVKPPTFVIFVNAPEIMHFSYQRYLENKFREAFGFEGTPLEMIIRGKSEDE